jgi:hypothetical protein
LLRRCPTTVATDATRISWMRLGARMAAFVAITYLAAGELTAM